MATKTTKKIDFTDLSQDLLQEGITTELLVQIQDTGKLSPAILTPGGEPTTLVRSNPESYWIQNEDGSFVKEGRELKKLDLKTCIIARARYYLLFLDQINAMDSQRRESLKEKELQREVDHLKRKLTEKVKTLQSQFERVEMWAYNLQNKMEVVILQNIDPDKAKANYENAKEWLKQHPDAKKYIDQITQELDAGDFDSLYLRFESDGVPLLFSSRYDDLEGMAVIKKIFSKDKLENTLEKIAGKSHLESVAMMTIEKRYAQKETPL